MSQYSHYKRQRRYERDESPFYRPRARAKIMGVCAGIAHQLGWDVTLVRIIAVLALFTLTGPTLLAYIIAGALFY